MTLVIKWHQKLIFPSDDIVLCLVILMQVGPAEGTVHTELFLVQYDSERAPREWGTEEGSRGENVCHFMLSFPHIPVWPEPGGLGTEVRAYCLDLQKGRKSHSAAKLQSGSQTENTKTARHSAGSSGSFRCEVDYRPSCCWASDNQHWKPPYELQ